ncbi:MAG: hypothetical protein Q4C96_06825 [Planctomycetia bacterium]|nr:hypothetical protein [Planctomycetia bacterium]
MRTFRWCFIGMVIFAVFTLLAGLLIWYALKCEPTFYKNQKVNNREHAEINSKSMNQKVYALRNDLRNPEAHEWTLEFTEMELNHWLEIDIKKKHPGAIPRRISEPRGIIRENMISCGAKVDLKKDQYAFQGVASVDFLPELVAPNVFEFKIFDIRAGIISLPRGIMLKKLAEIAEELAFPVEWEKKDGYHIMRITFIPGELQSEGRDLTIHEIKLGHGKILIRGSIAAKK